MICNASSPLMKLEGEGTVCAASTTRLRRSAVCRRRRPVWRHQRCEGERPPTILYAAFRLMKPASPPSIYSEWAKWTSPPPTEAARAVEF